jgi:uncharacterized HAD superfamily protein
MLTKWEQSESEKVCGVDIDGVLNYYPKPWVDFVNMKLGTSFNNLKEAKSAIPYQTYKDLKFEYRECGIKRTLPVREGAPETLQLLKELGYTIIILTSRPFSEHKTLYKQTTDWLDANNIPYDGIIFGEDKYLQILSKVPNLRFMIEDHRYYANLISKWGYTVFLVTNEYNVGKIGENVIRVDNIKEVLDHVWE